MLFLLSTPEYNNLQSNTTKVKVHLRSGIAEIFDLHQDLMGKVENNIVEIETNFENRIEKLLFIVQDAVFIVSNKGLDATIENKGTGVYVYAKRVKEITSNFSYEELSKQYEQKKEQLELETSKLSSEGSTAMDKVIKSRILLLKEDLEFFNRVQVIVKNLKA